MIGNKKMSLHIPERVKIEDFVIEDKIIKGVNVDVDLTHSIGEHLFDTLTSRPHHVAQIEVETGRQTTFAEMKDRSVRCAIWLKQQGVGSNDIVVICSKNNLDIYAPLFGTFYIGGIFSGWSPFIGSSKPIQHLMKLFQPKVVFASEDVVDILHEAAKLEKINTKFVVFGKHTNFETINDILKLPNEEDVRRFQPKKVHLSDNAVIMLTSGSTGFSKGVVHSYENMLKFVAGLCPFAMNGVILWYSTCDWVTGLGYTLQSVILYGTRIMHAKFEAEETCRIIEEYKIEKILLSSAAMNQMLKANVFKRYDIQSLKLVCAGGSKVNSQALQGFRDALPQSLVLQMYGMSELGRCIASQTENSKSLDSTGFLSSNQQLKIIDVNTGQILGYNEPGEFCIKSSLVMTGYFKNPEATKEVLDEDGWLHTGDKGYYDENGEIYIVDRIKEMMKYQSHQISPSEVEQVLLSHSEVVEVSVVPIPHPDDGDRPMAFVKKIPDSQVTEEKLIQLSISMFGELKKLHKIKFLDQLPKTASGKINRPMLKEMAKAMATET